MDGLDDVENSMLYYNQAIILYHLRQYTEAISIGEKLYQFIEPFGKCRSFHSLVKCFVGSRMFICVALVIITLWLVKAK